jgi:hypothetical protein
MTEKEWLNSSNPDEMLLFLGGTGRASERKLRLFAIACCRCMWHMIRNERTRRAVKTAERFVDGLAKENELQAAWAEAMTVCWFRGTSNRAAGDAAATAAQVATTVMAVPEVGIVLRGVMQALRHAENGNLSIFLRDIFFNPFRPKPAIPAVVLAWNSGCVVKLASSMYEEKDFSQERMGVLADALEEAGVTNEDVLAHLRSPGPHSRGCWAVDLVLGKE